MLLNQLNKMSECLQLIVHTPGHFLYTYSIISGLISMSKGLLFQLTSAGV
jgi:hypothetical protein